MSWFNRLKEGLSRSSEKLTMGLTEIFTHRKLDAQALQDLEDLLIQADLGLPVTEALLEALKAQKYASTISVEEVRTLLAEHIAQQLAPYVGDCYALPADREGPYTILIAGVNGSGKTTTIAKLGQGFKDRGYSVRFGAGDTFRAAATEQLSVWGERLGIPITHKQPGADAAALCYETYATAKAEGTDVVILDTAGRLHTNHNLMEELKKIHRVLHKHGATIPHATWLIVDATLGQNAYQQVDVFHKAVGLSGLIITKLDGTAKGGVVVGVADQFKLPILAIGVGESAHDLQPFKAQDFSQALVF